MTHSMTAFARQTEEGPWGSATCELRSVNHRYLELSVRLPEALSLFEIPFRERLKQHVSRGKVECQFRFQPAQGEGPTLRVDTRRAEALVEASLTVARLLPHAAPLNPMDVLRWPEVLQTVEKTSSADLQTLLMALLDRTVAEFSASREREGEALKKVFFERLSAMEKELMTLRERLPLVLAKQRTRLVTRLAEVSVQLDPARLEQEMVLFAQKIDVTEEMERLDAHIAEVKRVLKKEIVAGRRLDFLMQEMNREANTLGSKSTDIETTRTSVELKVLIEQMREQVQNIE